MRWKGDRHGSFVEHSGDFPALGAAPEPEPEQPSADDGSSSQRRLLPTMTIPELLLGAVQRQQLPKFLKLLITVRSEDEDDDEQQAASVVSLVSKLTAVRLDVEKDASSARRTIWWHDVHFYVENAMKVGFVNQGDPAAVDRLCELSQGNVLYAATVLEDIHVGRFSWVDVVDLQPGLGFLLSRHLSSTKLEERPELGLAIEVLMVADASADVIEEALRTVLPRSAWLTATKVERMLKQIPNRLLSSKKSDDADESLTWRLSHEAIRRWLAGYGQQLSATHGHQMLAARLAYRLATASLRAPLARWMDQSDQECVEMAIDAPTELLQLAIHASAARNGDDSAGGSAVLQALGAVVLARTPDTGESALHLCVNRGETGAVAALLLEAADRHSPSFVQGQDVAGRTALVVAARDGQAALVRCLLEFGADPAIRDGQRRTAVSHAVACGRHAALRLLLASPRAWMVVQLPDSKHGRTPIDVAKTNGDSTAQQMLLAALSRARRSGRPRGGNAPGGRTDRRALFGQ